MASSKVLVKALAALRLSRSQFTGNKQSLSIQSYTSQVLARSHIHPLCFMCAQNSSYSRSSSRNSSYGRRKPRYALNEDEFDNEDIIYAEEDLEDLRKVHREQARQEHVSEGGAKFSDFPIHEKLATRLEALGYKEPFAIQTQTLQHTLTGRDVIGRAVTGSGKTLAFAIPIVHKILQMRAEGKRPVGPKAIVISPTRELCMQIYRSIQELNSSIMCVPLYGGASFYKQEEKMRKGVDVICATPGRLNDHLYRGTFDLNDLQFLCLDEGDELLNPNFKEQINDVLDNSPEEKQMLIFSATMPPDIRHITRRYMSNPEYVDISGTQKKSAPDNIKHLGIKVDGPEMLSAVSKIIEEHNVERCIIFTATKRDANKTAEILKMKMRLKAEPIHSDLSQNRREIILGKFRRGVVKCLVATDVAARGLDIPEVDMVIQVGPPRNGVDYYIHRAGRTGRGGRDGLAVLLHLGLPSDRDILREIGKLVKLNHVEAPDVSDMPMYDIGLGRDVNRKPNFKPQRFQRRWNNEPRRRSYSEHRGRDRDHFADEDFDEDFFGNTNRRRSFSETRSRERTDRGRFAANDMDINFSH